MTTTFSTDHINCHAQRISRHFRLVNNMEMEQEQYNYFVLAISSYKIHMMSKTCKHIRTSQGFHPIVDYFNLATTTTTLVKQPHEQSMSIFDNS